MAAAVSAVGVLGLTVGALGGIDRQAQDLLQPGAGTTGEVVVVGIDREALARTGGAWPWPRDEHAALLEAVATGNPTVVVYDVLLADETDGDDLLAAALAEVPTVLASSLTLQFGDGGPPMVLDRLGPNEQLREAATLVGHANVRVNERAGIVRTIPFYAANERGVPVPSLALAATQVVDDAVGPVIERPEGVQVGSRLVPLDNGDLRVNWSASFTGDDIVSAAAVLDGTVDPAIFEDRVVLIGVDEPTLGDLHLTPLDRSGSMPGVLIHANAINTILGSAFLTDASLVAVATALFLLVLLVTVAFVWLRLRYAFIVLGIAVAVSVGWSSWRFHGEGELWPVVWPILVLQLAAMVGTTWRYATEYRHRRRAQSMFARYVPDAVVADLGNARLLSRLSEARSADIAALFCDLRGFTAIAGALDPAEVRQLLDHFYGYAVDIVHGHGGTVMMFVGDEVLAVFGAPLPDDDRCNRALATARDLVDRVDELDARLAADDLPSVRFGIGVNEGPAVAAHVGAADRLQYTVIGDTVNVASRLCSWAATGHVITSPWMLEQSSVGGFEAAETVEFKGVAEPVQLQRYTASYGDPLERRTGK